MIQNEFRALKLWLQIGIFFILLLFNSWFLHWNFQRVSDQDGWVSHTHEVISELNAAFSSTKAAESGVRGYALSGNADDLDGVQDPKSAEMSFMPESALRQMRPDAVLNLPQIAEHLLNLSREVSP